VGSREFLVDDIFPRGLGLGDALDQLEPVAVYVLGMAAYALFAFRFHRFVAARDMFELDLSRYEESRFRPVRAFLHLVMYVAKYIVLFPFLAFFWFAVLTLILTFLSKEKPFADVLLMALVTVGTIRVTSYVSEDLSADLAKILPFSVLAIFIIDASVFDVRQSVEALEEVGDYSESILYYLAFLIALEFALRLLMGIAQWLFGGDHGAPTPPAPEPELPTRRRARLWLVRRRRFTVRHGGARSGAAVSSQGDEDPAAQ